MSAIQKLVDHFGDQTRTAKALGVSQAAVSYWLAGIHTISAEHAFKAEEITEGLVTAKELCAREKPRVA
ncbi:transcriptional regulator [Pseudomonas paralcaligenes]|uniref:transcriptional regulator n=1 Tax=Pseudomonas paralcaligenes TaxID=2772558 RepID=UPI001C81B2D8|nr:Cro/CI family transcriptional regulator [Pseudomonas paralcaligenes]